MTRLDELLSAGAAKLALDYVRSLGAERAREAFRQSMFFQRMFQLDFFLSLGEEDMDALVRQAWLAPARDRSVFAMQVLLSKSGSRGLLRTVFRRRTELRDLSASFGSLNPYTYFIGSIPARMCELDKVCFAACEDGPMLAPHRFFSAGDLDYFLDNVGFSLFAGRTMQSDFLESLPEELRPAMLRGVLVSAVPGHAVRFYKSVLASGLGMDLKKTVLREMISRDMQPAAPDGRFYSDMLSDPSGIHELILRDAVDGRRLLGPAFAMYLLLHMPDRVRLWTESGGELPPYMRPEDIDELAEYSRGLNDA